MSLPVRTAPALGCTLSEAEDPAQTTLLKVYVARHKVMKADHRDAYVSKMLVNAHRDTHRRRWRRETSVADVPDVHEADATGASDTADAVRRAVSGLSRGATRGRRAPLLRSPDRIGDRRRSVHRAGHGQEPPVAGARRARQQPRPDRPRRDAMNHDEATRLLDDLGERVPDRRPAMASLVASGKKAKRQRSLITVSLVAASVAVVLGGERS
ncbi:hypothetical protein [Nocardioides sp. B-3]|uniref:hypothetical protein n=1 Tax=Nocardioides sp. B-3 TaxID=2895565 RepID=UPI003FA54EB2